MRKSLVSLVILAIAVTATSGCLGNSVSVSKSGAGFVDDSKRLSCGGSGTISSEFGGTSDITVTVTDGDGNTIYAKGSTSGGWEGGGQTLTGLPGKWTLTVKGSYAGDLKVKLSC